MDYIHPLQPVIEDNSGVLRFQKNELVSYLAEWATSRGLGLTELGMMPFSQSDRIQFSQLTGSSLCYLAESGRFGSEEVAELAKALHNAPGENQYKVRAELAEAEVARMREVARKFTSDFFGVEVE